MGSQTRKQDGYSLFVALFDVSPLNPHFCWKLQELIRVILIPSSAFSGSKVHVKTLIQDTLQKTMLQGEAIRSAPGETPPEIEGAGNMPSLQPGLKIDSEQQAP